LSKFIHFPKDITTSVIKYDFDVLTAEERAEKYKVVCMIGVTGTGKSSTGNTIIKTDFFDVSNSADSVTSETRGCLGKWLGDTKKETILLIDTPGIGDSKNRDTENIANMVMRLKLVGHINSFVIVMNSQEPRFDEQLQNTLKLFQ
jgi:predicted GTPase